MTCSPFQFISEGQVALNKCVSPCARMLSPFLYWHMDAITKDKRKVFFFQFKILSSQKLVHSLKKKPHTDFVFLKSFVLMRSNSLVTGCWIRKRMMNQTDKTMKSINWLSPDEEGFTSEEGLMPTWAWHVHHSTHPCCTNVLPGTTETFTATSSW